MNSQEPKPHPLQAIGIFLAGVGILIAGIAYLIWVLRCPSAPCPVEPPPRSVPSRAASAAEIQKYIADHKDLEKIIHDSEFHQWLEEFGKETLKDQPVKKVETKTETLQP
ncbi:MAG: hypothetical protein JXB10_07785 [Pirellulales bacterium]|nr:hypothetical protein [Pirellulales bacterium]